MIIQLFLCFFLEGTDLKFENTQKGENYSLRNTSRMRNIDFVG